jgi:proteasome lid subunit RPN8/RPN11
MTGPASGAPRLVVTFEPDALKRLGDLVRREATGTELMGLLVGSVEPHTGTGNILVHIVDYLPARYTRAGPTFVSTTDRTWQDLLERKQSAFPDSTVVGWYHTHPDAPFLSAEDERLHRSFFPNAWHVALVSNAEFTRRILFGWVDGSLKRIDFR